MSRHPLLPPNSVHAVSVLLDSVDAGVLPEGSVAICEETGDRVCYYNAHEYSAAWFCRDSAELLLALYHNPQRLPDTVCRVDVYDAYSWYKAAGKRLTQIILNDPLTV